MPDDVLVQLDRIKEDLDLGLRTGTIGFINRAHARLDSLIIQLERGCREAKTDHEDS